jgi:hypothetical protein
MLRQPPPKYRRASLPAKRPLCPRGGASGTLDRLAKTVCLAAICFLAATPFAPKVLAQTSEKAAITEGEKSAARAAGQEAVEQFRAGNFKQAKSILEKVQGLVGLLPTTSYLIGRCDEKLGQWVAASERYLQASRLKPKPGMKQHLRAIESAKKARAKLLPRIPKLVLVLELAGGKTAEARILLDGVALKAALLGLPLPVDPGEHRIHISAGKQQKQASFMAVEGKTQRLNIHFDKASGEPAALPGQQLPPQQAKPPAAQPPTTGTPSAPPKTSSKRRWGFVTLGLGAAAVAAGGILGGFALAEESELKTLCPNATCPRDGNTPDRIAKYNSLRIASFVGLGVGAALGTTSLVLLLRSSSDEKASQDTKQRVGRMQWSLRAGLNGLALRGNF